MGTTKYEELTEQQVAQFAENLKVVYGDAYIGKAMHDLHRRGTGADAAKIANALSEESDVSEARAMLIGLGAQQYENVTNLINEDASWADVIKDNVVVPSQIPTLLNRAEEARVATGKRLQRAVQYVKENLGVLWSFIRELVFGGPEATARERSLLAEVMSQASYLFTATVRAVSAAVSVVLRGVVKVARSVLGLITSAVKTMTATAFSVADFVLKMPEYADGAVKKAQRRITYIMFLVACGFSELTTMLSASVDDTRKRITQLVRLISAQFSRLKSYLNRMLDIELLKVAWIGVKAIPLVNDLIRLFGIAGSSVLRVVRTITSRLEWIMQTLAVFLADPAELLVGILHSAVPSIAEMLASLARRFNLASGADFDVEKMRKLQSSLRILGSRKGDISKDTRKRCREAADDAQRVLTMLQERMDDYRDLTATAKVSTMYKNTMLSAQLMTSVYYYEEVDKEKLDRLTVNRYGGPAEEIFLAVSKVHMNMVAQMETAIGEFAFLRGERLNAEEEGGDVTLRMGASLDDLQRQLTEAKARVSVGGLFGSGSAKEQENVSLLREMYEEFVGGEFPGDTIDGLVQAHEAVREAVEASISMSGAAFSADALVLTEMANVNQTVLLDAARSNYVSLQNALMRMGEGASREAENTAETMKLGDELLRRIEARIVALRARKAKWVNGLGLLATASAGLLIYFYLLPESELTPKEKAAQAEAHTTKIFMYTSKGDDPMMKSMIDIYREKKGEKADLGTKEGWRNFFSFWRDDIRNAERGDLDAFLASTGEVRTGFDEAVKHYSSADKAAAKSAGYRGKLGTGPKAVIEMGKAIHGKFAKFFNEDDQTERAFINSPSFIELEYTKKSKSESGSGGGIWSYANKLPSFFTGQRRGAAQLLEGDVEYILDNDSDDEKRKKMVKIMAHLNPKVLNYVRGALNTVEQGVYSYFHQPTEGLEWAISKVQAFGAWATNMPQFKLGSAKAMRETLSDVASHTAAGHKGMVENYLWMIGALGGLVVGSVVWAFTLFATIIAVVVSAVGGSLGDETGNRGLGWYLFQKIAVSMAIPQAFISFTQVMLQRIADNRIAAASFLAQLGATALFAAFPAAAGVVTVLSKANEIVTGPLTSIAGAFSRFFPKEKKEGFVMPTFEDAPPRETRAEFFKRLERNAVLRRHALAEQLHRESRSEVSNVLRLREAPVTTDVGRLGVTDDDNDAFLLEPPPETFYPSSEGQLEAAPEIIEGW